MSFFFDFASVCSASPNDDASMQSSASGEASNNSLTLGDAFADISPDISPPPASENKQEVNYDELLIPRELYFDNDLSMRKFAASETFCMVPGRLTLLSASKKYRVTLAEVERRIYGPECLNSSFLGAILRKAKNKDGGRCLRDMLKARGIFIQAGKRSSTPPTCFTSMVEEEAQQLARDFGDIIKSNYPHDEVARYVVNSAPVEMCAANCRNELIAARLVNRRLLQYHLSEWACPCEHHVCQNREHGNSKQLAEFSSLTHSFGCPTIQHVLHLIDEVLDVAIGATQTMLTVPESESATP